MDRTWSFIVPSNVQERKSYANETTSSQVLRFSQLDMQIRQTMLLRSPRLV